MNYSSERVVVERREQHKSSPELTDCLEELGHRGMNAMLEKLKIF